MNLVRISNVRHRISIQGTLMWCLEQGSGRYSQDCAEIQTGGSVLLELSCPVWSKTLISQLQAWRCFGWWECYGCQCLGPEKRRLQGSSRVGFRDLNHWNEDTSPGRSGDAEGQWYEQRSGGGLTRGSLPRRLFACDSKT